MICLTHVNFQTISTEPDIYLSNSIKLNPELTILMIYIINTLIQTKNM